MENPEARQSWKLPEPWSKGRIAALLLILATIVVYWPALHGGFLWDDDDHISANIKLRSLSGLWDIWFKPGATMQYYPLTFTGFWVGYHLWGLNPFGYHLLTVVLHGVVAVLLWQVLERLKVRGASLAGAIFALHPVNVMSVAWMTELKNTLAGALALGASWAYVRFAGLGVYAATEPDLNKNPSASCWCYGVLSLALFLLAMFAKTAVSFLPVSLLLVLWWQRERLRWREVWPLLAMLGMVVVMGQVTFYIERLHGATGEEFRIGLLERLLISGRSFWFYLGKLFFPYRLTFIYPRWHVDAGVWWQYVYPLATVGVLGALWTMRRRIGKGPFVAMLHFYVATSLLILIQVLYMTRFSFVTDHWQYFGCMSVIGMAAAGITMALGFLEKRNAFLKPVFSGALLLVLSVLTWQQSETYRDNETLWQTTIARNPNCSMAQNNLGNVFLRRGQVDEALVHFQEAVAIQPDNAEAHNDLGTALLQKGDLDEAITHFQKALELRANYADPHINLAVAFVQKGQGREAITHLQTSLEIRPDNPMALNNLAFVLATAPDASVRNGAKAVEFAQQAEQLTRGKAPAIIGTLAAAYAEAGRFPEAVATAQRALQLAALQSNLGLVNALQTQIELYQQGTPLRDSGRAEAPASPAQP